MIFMYLIYLIFNIVYFIYCFIKKDVLEPTLSIYARIFLVLTYFDLGYYKNEIVFYLNLIILITSIVFIFLRSRYIFVKKFRISNVKKEKLEEVKQILKQYDCKNVKYDSKISVKTDYIFKNPKQVKTINKKLKRYYTITFSDIAYNIFSLILTYLVFCYTPKFDIIDIILR